MTRFSMSMNEALDFILHSTEIAKGSEIFVPKLRAYSIAGLKEVLFELLDSTGEEIIGIREGEKLNEILINSDEVRYSWEYEDMYMILNPSVHTHSPSLHESSSKKKISNMTEYSSDTVEKIPKDEMKKIILNSGLLD